MVADLFGAGALAHDPGGSKRFRLQPGVRGSAQFGGPRQEYRHWLRRDWGGDGAPYALWIGMNPSTAEAHVDDPTIRREMEFTRRLGFTSYIKVNVMDYRATHPQVLLLLLAGSAEWLSSPENLQTIAAKAAGAEMVVAAWGSLPKALRGYASDAAGAVIGSGRLLTCLGTTADGSPRHPLYIRGDAAFIPWARR